MDCLFCKIISGELNADIIHRDDQIIAIRDINPQAPTHILIIPIKHISTINDLTDIDSSIIANSVLVAKKLAFDENIHLSGYRLLWNVNKGAGQAVFHIHLHLLGGRSMQWPPG